MGPIHIWRYCMFTTRSKKLSGSKQVQKPIANAYAATSGSSFGSTPHLLARLSLPHAQSTKTSSEPDCTELTGSSEAPVVLQDSNIFELVKKLRTGGFDKSSHIPFLEPEVKSQLAFAKSTLETPKQLELFDQFQLEFEQCIANQTLSYEWWICFAHRLTILITPENCRTPWFVTIMESRDFLLEMLTNNLWQRQEDFAAHLQREDLADAVRFRSSISLFPQCVMIPTTLGDINITLLNRAAAANIYPLGIIATGIWADNQFYYPDRFIRHDWVHFMNWLNLNLEDNVSVQLFQDFMLHLIEKTTFPRLKLQYEFMLFYLIREVPWRILHLEINRARPEDTAPKIKSLLLTSEGDPDALLKACFCDKWYAPLLAEQVHSEEESNRFVLEAIDQFIICLNAFLTFIHNDTFHGTPSVKRKYTIDTPLNEAEIAAHWTTTNQQAAEIIQRMKWMDTRVLPPDFYHYLVRNDSEGPDYTKNSSISPVGFTFCYLRSKKDEFRFMPPSDWHMELLADSIATQNAEQLSDLYLTMAI